MMNLVATTAFFFLGLSILSLWVHPYKKIWVPLLGASLLAGVIAGIILPIGLVILMGWGALWTAYTKNHGTVIRALLFAMLIILSFGFKFHLFPGYHPIVFSPKFYLGLEVTTIELLPLALLVPLAATRKEWRGVLKGALLGCVGIGALALLAVSSGAITLHFKLPSFWPLRYLSNLLFVAAVEEGFYRGFIQKQLSYYLKGTKAGAFIALVLSSLIFTLAHIYWAPSGAILGFVFLASLLYGGVYLISGKIESAILTHFLLNFVHMTFFSYHAM